MSRSPLARAIQGTVDIGSLVDGYPVLVGGSDPGGTAQYLTVDNSGRLQVTGAGGAAGPVVGTLSNNTLPPSNNNLGVLPAVATINPISYTDLQQVLLNTDQRGSLRVRSPVDSLSGTLAGAGQTVLMTNTIGAGTVTVGLVAAAFTGTVVLETSGDNVNWVAVTGTSFDGTSGGSSFALAGAINKVLVVSLQGAPFFRVRCSAFTSGALVVSLWAGFGDGPLADGWDLATGATTDSAVLGDVAGSISAKLRGISRILNDVWDGNVHNLAVETGSARSTQLNAVAIATTPAALDYSRVRGTQAIQAFGTATSLTLYFEGSLDGANWQQIGTTISSLPAYVTTPNFIARFVRTRLFAVAGGNVTTIVAGI